MKDFVVYDISLEPPATIKQEQGTTIELARV